jgi:chromosome segregation ATPase
MERTLHSRTIEVEKREQKLIDLESKIDDLNKQRANFELYKSSLNKELDEAKVIIAEADASFEKIQIEKDMLAGREIKVKEQEKIWNDEIGKLEKDKRDFQMEKENIVGLKNIKKEEVNVGL